jgi:hypothetical protein
MKKLVIIITFFSALTFISGNLYAKIVVEDTKGEAAYKKGNQWLPLTKGLPLEEGTKISTGVKSWALINIDGDSLKINQLTMMKIYKNQVTANNKNTHIGLKHGSLNARVSKLNTLKTSFKITTPVATSSVRGTEEKNWQGAKSGNLVHAPSGRLEVEDRNGNSYFVEGNATFKISPDDPRPQNLLSSERGRSLIKLSDPNTTGDENKSQEFSGLDSLSNDNNPGKFVRPSLSPATVILQVGW